MKIFHIGLSATGLPTNALQDALMTLGTYKEINTAHPDLNNEILRIANEFRPDLVFIQVQTPGIIQVETVRRLKTEFGAWVCNWTGDIRHPIPDWYIEMAPHINTTLFTNMTDVNSMRSMGLHSDYLQIGIAPKIFAPTGPILPSIPPIVFMANNYEDHKFPLTSFRREIAMIMKREFKWQFGLYGNGWNSADGNFNNSQEQEAAAYRSAKIAINCSHFTYSRYSSDRLFRILGSGTFCLTHRWPEIEKDFSNGKHFVIFEDIEDLVNKCKFYLDVINEEERKNIAATGCALAHEKYTFQDMANNLLKIYKNAQPSPRTSARR